MQCMVVEGRDEVVGRLGGVAVEGAQVARLEAEVREPAGGRLAGRVVHGLPATARRRRSGWPEPVGEPHHGVAAPAAQVADVDARGRPLGEAGDEGQDRILEHGFAGTSVDEVLDQTGSTKGTFLHHFASKADLGRALVDRWAQADTDHLERTMAHAEGLAADPLERLLTFTDLLIDEAGDHAPDQVGCLFASFLYERGMVDAPTRAVIAGSMGLWRDRLADLMPRPPRPTRRGRRSTRSSSPMGC
jgi:AcrR family transcriptional regulator